MMSIKRFQWVYIGDGELELQDYGIVKRFERYRLEEFLNELHEEIEELKGENEQLKQKLSFNENNDTISFHLKWLNSTEDLIRQFKDCQNEEELLELIKDNMIISIPINSKS